MATPYYLISAEPKHLKAIAKTARELAGISSGDPVIALGSHRIALAPEAINALEANDPTKPLVARLEAMKAAGAWPISSERLTELVAARDALELTVPRLIPTGALVTGGYDWHLKATRLVEAWKEVGKEGGGHWDKPGAWGNIRIGHIDTGYREHPCLGWSGATESAFVLTNLDRNFFPNDFDPGAGMPMGSEDSALDPMAGAAFDGHGLRTASVLAGFDKGRDAQLEGTVEGYFGAAPCVPHIPVRICDSVFINHVQLPLALAIEYLVHNGCQVITLSMGMALTFTRGRLRRAINYAYDKGVIFICAAGNRWESVVAPARMNRTIAVGGSTPSSTPWIDSSFGPEVDICAPAWPIRRASITRSGKPTYGYGDGTSFATPLVAGTAALWLLHHGEKIASTYREGWQCVEAFKHVLKTTAQPGENWNSRLYGPGILNALDALRTSLPEPAQLLKDNPA